MDYTTLERVKSAMGAEETRGDAIISDYITRTSRLLDRLSTSQPNVSNYFMQEDITDEILTNGVINWMGELAFYPHKPVINSISALAYRFSLHDTWRDADPTYVICEEESVTFEGPLPQTQRVFVKVSYNGGLAESVEDLPADLIDIATAQTIRLFKEERSGMSDIVGVVELGTLSYSKAFLQRVTDTLNAGGYARIAPWT